MVLSVGKDLRDDEVLTGNVLLELLEEDADLKERFRRLTSKQRRFVIAVSMKDIYAWSWRQCYQWATNDYVDDPKRAAVSSCIMRASPSVAFFIDRLERVWIENMGVTLTNLAQEEMNISFSDITKFFDDDGLMTIDQVKNLPEGLRRSIKDIEIVNIPAKYEEDGKTMIEPPVVKAKITLWDKGQSLGRLQKLKGAYAPEKREISGSLEANIVNRDEQARERRASLLEKFVPDEDE